MTVRSAVTPRPLSLWSVELRDLKNYPHFDPVISAAEATALASDPARVARHSFYPFMRFVQRWTRYSPKGECGPQKKRPIRYAARADAYIFSRYRHILAQGYEDQLSTLGLGEEIMVRVQALIRHHGRKLNIKPEKTSLFVFEQQSKKQRCQLVSGSQGKNGLEYLGFRYDGKKVYIRDSTLSNLQRKIVRRARGEAIAAVKRYSTHDISYIKEHFDYEGLIARFGRVRDFDDISEDCKNWTFWTYVQRAAHEFGSLGTAIPLQLRGHRLHIRTKVDQQLERAVARRNRD